MRVPNGSIHNRYRVEVFQRSSDFRRTCSYRAADFGYTPTRRRHIRQLIFARPLWSITICTARIPDK